ncbi:MAG: hypothetical protein BWY93_01065 [Euryarchaeota archaeon ADurb.BinA087]|nr:MAG: hypothetical protein BWY93_01065 [Euryarchaeota archaeon ADurb.BinA087]
MKKYPFVPHRTGSFSCYPVHVVAEYVGVKKSWDRRGMDKFGIFQMKNIRD